MTRRLCVYLVALCANNLALAQLDFGNLFESLLNRQQKSDELCNEGYAPEDIVRDMQAADNGCVSQLSYYMQAKHRSAIGTRLKYCQCDKEVAQNENAGIAAISGLFTGEADFGKLIPGLDVDCNGKVDRLLCQELNKARPNTFCNLCTFIKLTVYNQDLQQCTCATHIGDLKDESLRGTLFQCINQLLLDETLARELGALENGNRCRTKPVEFRDQEITAQ